MQNENSSYRNNALDLLIYMCVAIPFVLLLNEINPKFSEFSVRIAAISYWDIYKSLTLKLKWAAALANINALASCLIFFFFLFLLSCPRHFIITYNMHSFYLFIFCSYSHSHWFSMWKFVKVFDENFRINLLFIVVKGGYLTFAISTLCCHFHFILHLAHCIWLNFIRIVINFFF